MLRSLNLNTIKLSIHSHSFGGLYLPLHHNENPNFHHHYPPGPAEHFSTGSMRYVQGGSRKRQHQRTKHRRRIEQWHSLFNGRSIHLIDPLLPQTHLDFSERVAWSLELEIPILLNLPLSARSCISPTIVVH